MLIPFENVNDLLEALSAMGAKWGPKNQNPGQPTYKGMFRESIIAFYVDAPISEIICLNPKASAEFETIVKGFFEIPEDALEDGLTDQGG